MSFLSIHGLCSFLLLHMSTVILSTHNLQLDPWQVLCPPALYQNNVVLLQVVAFAWDETDDLLAVAEPHTGTLAVGRIGLLGLADQGLKDDPLELRVATSGAKFGRRPLGTAEAVHLVESSHGTA